MKILGRIVKAFFFQIFPYKMAHYTNLYVLLARIAQSSFNSTSSVVCVLAIEAAIKPFTKFICKHVWFYFSYLDWICSTIEKSKTKRHTVRQTNQDWNKRLSEIEQPQNIIIYRYISRVTRYMRKCSTFLILDHQNNRSF